MWKRQIPEPTPSHRTASEISLTGPDFFHFSNFRDLHLRFKVKAICDSFEKSKQAQQTPNS
jgi:hypothetical protein